MKQARELFKEMGRASGLPAGGISDVLSQATQVPHEIPNPPTGASSAFCALPRGGRTQLNPVAECDVIETVSRALADGTPWSGWYEVAGPRVWTLAELRMLAAGGGSGGVPGAWEPAKEETPEHRLAESGPWCERFALTPTAIEDAVGQEVRT